MTKACEGDLSLSTAVKMAREYEAARAHMKEIARDQEEQVNKLITKRKKRVTQMQILNKETRHMDTTEEEARETEWDATTVGRNMYEEFGN